MVNSNKCHFNVKYSIIMSFVVSLAFAVVFFLFFAYNIGVEPNIIFIVNVVPLLFFGIGVVRNKENKELELVTSILYTLLNIMLSTGTVIMTMIVFFLTGVLYM